MILMDVRNNSAWNYRYYVLFSNPDKPSKETLDHEIEFTKNKIQLAPNNSSGWSYLTA
jgi:protein farnesyltransferase/geranylgeranyltransferase type-1 subunit alpha